MQSILRLADIGFYFTNGHYSDKRRILVSRFRPPFAVRNYEFAVDSVSTTTHCMIEHSAAINVNTLLKSVIMGALKSKLFEPDCGDIKVKVESYSNHETGNEKIDFFSLL